MTAATLLAAPACLGEPAATRDLPVFAEDSAAPLLVGAGDIAFCTRTTDEATAQLLDRIPGTVFTLGDHVYPHGTAEEFAACYGPTWGRHRDRTRPSPGNHDYATPDGRAYFDYFGSRAGDRDKGYYSYDLGTWHIVALNSTVALDEGSPQLAWLQDDLRRTDARCLLAYWHHPRFTSGTRAPEPALTAVWEALHAAGAEVVLGGHEHNYERFAPQAPDGTADPARGIRQFVVGTGGANAVPFGAAAPHSEKRGIGFGVLVLRLHPDRYDWQFVPAGVTRFTDSGTTACH